MRIKIKLEPGAIIPVKKTEGAACYDCYACLKRKVIILPFQTKLISLGIRTEFDSGYYLEIRGRSGNSLKGKQIVIGTVDSDYRGIINSITYNGSIFPKIVKPGDRIAQMIIKEVIPAELTMSDSLSETKRGNGGFGSTGKNG